jgi:hypothetical protein
MSSDILTPKQQAIWALERKPPRPNSKVPTFELEFQLTQELLGKEYHHWHEFQNASSAERDRMLRENAELYIEVAERLDYSIIMMYTLPMMTDSGKPSDSSATSWATNTCSLPTATPHSPSPPVATW